MFKGQEEAPIELLIGVTVLTFVIIISMTVFNTTCATQQEQKLKASFSKFARDLELVYFGAVGSSQIARLDFTQMSGCAEYEVESIRITKGPGATCRAQLGKDDCLVLTAVSKPTELYGPRGTVLLEVLDISADTNIINHVNKDSSGNILCKDVSGDIYLNRINWDLDDDKFENCWFSPQYYSVKITKTAADEIVLEAT